MKSFYLHAKYQKCFINKNTEGDTYFRIAQVLVLAAFVVGIFGSSLSSYTPAPSNNAPAPIGPAQYDFNYALNHDYSNNDFGHQENHNGYNTQGAYFALFPDGRVQRVSYTVNGDSGYVAQVTYEGEAQYGVPRPSTSYQPVPTYT
ncbi:cuticle protein 8-like [Penaeus indicus]|uniref:cuticle protein 8-like n=1 Tax=Penaeus indicus TaxID=29960 RepID=UPI00300D1413